jgi:hypothetical protein
VFFLLLFPANAAFWWFFEYLNYGTYGVLSAAVSGQRRFLVVF